MKRRQFISVFDGTTVAWLPSADVPRPSSKMRRVAMLAVDLKNANEQAFEISTLLARGNEIIE